MPCKHWLEWTFIKVMPFLSYRPRWCLSGCVVCLPSQGSELPRGWNRYTQAERHHFTLHTEMVWNVSTHRDFHRIWKIDIPWILAVHMVNRLSALSLTTQHVCRLAGYRHFIQDKKTAMPEINTTSPALQKLRFCSGGESASYPLWKSRELTMTDIFSLQCSCKNCIDTSCGNVNPFVPGNGGVQTGQELSIFSMLLIINYVGI